MEQITAKNKKKSWLQLLLGVIVLIGFIYGIGPEISKRIQPAYYENLKASGIRPNALFYTDTKICAAAEEFVGDSLRFSPGN